ncbi:MAG: hypothetical protein ACLTKQ_07145 [Acutalibacteraceae bacterium]
MHKKKDKAGKPVSFTEPRPVPTTATFWLPLAEGLDFSHCSEQSPDQQVRRQEAGKPACLATTPFRVDKKTA